MTRGRGSRESKGFGGVVGTRRRIPPLSSENSFHRLVTNAVLANIMKPRPPYTPATLRVGQFGGPWSTSSYKIRLVLGALFRAGSLFPNTPTPHTTPPHTLAPVPHRLRPVESCGLHSERVVAVGDAETGRKGHFCCTKNITTHTRCRNAGILTVHRPTTTLSFEERRVCVLVGKKDAMIVIYKKKSHHLAARVRLPGLLVKHLTRQRQVG